jgi:hypothetical protein
MFWGLADKLDDVIKKAHQPWNERGKRVHLVAVHKSSRLHDTSRRITSKMKRSARGRQKRKLRASEKQRWSNVKNTFPLFSPNDPTLGMTCDQPQALSTCSRG